MLEEGEIWQIIESCLLQEDSFKDVFFHVSANLDPARRAFFCYDDMEYVV